MSWLTVLLIVIIVLVILAFIATALLLPDIRRYRRLRSM